MAQKKTWIKLYRDVIENDIWRYDQTAWHIFEYILIRVDKDTGKMKSAMRTIADYTNNPLSTTHDAIKRLRNAKMVNASPNGHYTVFSVVNWHKYQSVTERPTEQEPNKNRTATEHIQELRIKNKEDIVVHFEKIWERYPNRIGKKQALTHYKSSVKNQEDITKINHALDNYLASSQVKKGYIQHGSTWFNNWQDWVDFKETRVVKPAKQPDDFFDKEAGRAEIAKLKIKSI